MEKENLKQGGRIPMLKEGEQFPVGASFWNRLIGAINALLNLRVVYSDQIQAPTFKISDNNSVLLLPTPDGGNGSGYDFHWQIIRSPITTDAASWRTIQVTDGAAYLVNLEPDKWLSAPDGIFNCLNTNTDIVLDADSTYIVFAKYVYSTGYKFEVNVCKVGDSPTDWGRPGPWPSGWISFPEMQAFDDRPVNPDYDTAYFPIGWVYTSPDGENKLTITQLVFGTVFVPMISHIAGATDSDGWVSGGIYPWKTLLKHGGTIYYRRTTDFGQDGGDPADFADIPPTCDWVEFCAV